MYSRYDLLRPTFHSVKLLRCNRRYSNNSVCVLPCFISNSVILDTTSGSFSVCITGFMFLFLLLPRHSQQKELIITHMASPIIHPYALLIKSSVLNQPQCMTNYSVSAMSAISHRKIKLALIRNTDVCSELNLNQLKLRLRNHRMLASCGHGHHISGFH